MTLHSILGVALIALLQGCGGAKADKPFEPLVGAPGGYGNYVFRDASQATGGEPGHVNTASTIHAVAGPEITAFEWAGLAIMDNYSKAGENVGFYAQANKYDSGPTWAAVSEVADRSGASTGLVAHEFDVWTSGKDTGNRIAVDVVLGDVKVMRNLGKSDIVEGTAGIRIGANNNGKWLTGIEFTGRYDRGINMVNATTLTAIRLRDGQAIELSPGVTLVSKDRRILFIRDGEIILSL